MKATKRFVIIEETTDQEIASRHFSKFCPFTPDHKCQQSDCMMFVNISVRDVENPDIYYQSSGYGRCGLVNIPAQSRMFRDGQINNEKEYFISEIEPESGQNISED